MFSVLTPKPVQMRFWGHRSEISCKKTSVKNRLKGYTTEPWKILCKILIDAIIRNLGLYNFHM